MTICERCFTHQLRSPAGWHTAAYTTRAGRKLVWYVPFAEVIIRLRAAEQRPITPIVLHPDAIDALCRAAFIDLAHLDHLPEAALDVPGIGVTLPETEPLRLFIIDGVHRAARCRAEGRPFQLYLLDARESDVALLASDETTLY